MRQSERAIPGRYLTEDERAKSIAKFMDWYVKRRPNAVERVPDARWIPFFASPERYKWNRQPRPNTKWDKSNGR